MPPTESYATNLQGRLDGEREEVREYVRDVLRELIGEEVPWRKVRLLLGKARQGAAECVRLQAALATEMARVEAQRVRDVERQAAEQYVPMVQAFEEARQKGEQP